MTSSTSEKDQCPRCGKTLPAGEGETLCPACETSSANEWSNRAAQTIALTPGESLSLYGPSDFPCRFGEYRLLGLLGRGGMGAVYEAEQLSTGRRVALKILGKQFDSQTMRQRFFREGRLAAGVSHPNSLYVFGTEEIEGIPVIVMEIADGGTLSDKIEKLGRLPVGEAVDAILDVISGLEAAFTGGVLHRDVKPANCFVSPDGSVKVGDFGLSVSTAQTANTFVTAAGIIMGTLAYAPPEQLRGRETDHRADIYAVGATLFTLLTGQPPLEGRNAVEVVAAALDEKPKSVKDLCPDLPSGLAQVVARCLAKKPDQRYADYPTLRNALLPFSSEKAEPAPLGRRTLAGLIDCALLLGIPAFLLNHFWGIATDPEIWLRERTSSQLLGWMGMSLCGVLYYMVFEGIWGAALGKMLMGFRVSHAGGRTPGISRALVRALIGMLVVNLYALVALVVFSAEEFATGGLSKTVIRILCLFLGLSVFVTLRRHNGFATLWDLVTGTRVVVKPRGVVRPEIDIETSTDLPTADATSIGPYAIIETIIPEQWISAHDATLRRQVWLVRRKATALTSSRRDLARPGRLRWLQTVSTAETKWDVFEALPGASFSSLCNSVEKLHWESLRHWLHDLASELTLAADDGTLPAQLGLDHVWITQRGRAILLDRPWPRTERPAELMPVVTLADRQRFLDRVAQCVQPSTIPLHAQPVLKSLAEGSFEKISLIAGSLRSLLTKPARLDRSSRFATLFAMPLFIVAVFALGLMFSVWANIRTALRWTEAFPDLPPLNVVLHGRDSVGEKEKLFLIDMHVVGHYAHLAEYLKDPLLATQLDPPLGREELNKLKEIFDTPPRVTPKRLEEADLALSKKMPDFFREATSFPIAIIAMFPLMLCVAFAFSQVLSLALFRSTLGQFLFGFVVVNARGDPAGRLHLLCRWCVVWFLLVAAVVLLVINSDDPKYYLPALLGLLLWLGGVIYTVTSPNRGLHDRFARTWVVPV